MWGKPQEFAAPDGSFSLVLPKDWVAETKNDVAVFRAKKGVGTLRISAWRTRDEPGSLEAFLARKEQEFSSPTASEKKVLATDRINMADKKGLFRISQCEEDRVPLMVTLYLLGGGTTVVLATYIMPFALYGTPEGRSESRSVMGMLLKMTLR